MKLLVKSIIQTVAFSAGYRISKVTSTQALDSFFSVVRPISTNCDLLRLGGEQDGGYLIPDDLAGIRTCFSPGVSDIADFESDLTKRGVKCFLADHSVETPPNKHPLINFEKRFLGIEDDEENMTLDSWVRKSTHSEDNNLLLQMDIEGGEYDVLLTTSQETLKRFRILVIEFHKLDSLLDRIGYKRVFVTFRKILKHFEIVHIHPNNCNKPEKFSRYEIPPIMEFTFLRKDRIRNYRSNNVFPHKLDRPNRPHLPDYVLPQCWYDDRLTSVVK